MKWYQDPEYLNYLDKMDEESAQGREPHESFDAFGNRFVGGRCVQYAEESTEGAGRLSLDNGEHYLEVGMIDDTLRYLDDDERKYITEDEWWDALVMMMDDGVRESVANDGDYSRVEFLRHYLMRTPLDLVIG